MEHSDFSNGLQNFGAQNFDAQNGDFTRAFAENNAPIGVVSVATLKNNAKILKDLCCPAEFCAVIKANAYGHGLIETARAVENVADCFAAGCVSEGVALRQAGVLNPILCLIPAKKTEFSRAQKYGIKICINDLNSLVSLKEFAKTHVPPAFHLAINSGMNRLGIDDEYQAKAALKIICDFDLPLRGVFSHFYNAGDFCSCKKQFKRFLSIAEVFKSEFSGIKTHISSGGGLYYGDKFKLDCVRAGLGLYGYGYPLLRGGESGVSENKANESAFSNLKPALKIYAPLVQTRNLAAGENLLYGDYRLQKNQTADILSYGYYYGEHSGINGCLNKTCMNLCAVSGGEKSVFIAGEKYVCVMSDAQKTAQKTGASVYNVLTRASNIQKIYI